VYALGVSTTALSIGRCEFGGRSPQSLAYPTKFLFFPNVWRCFAMLQPRMTGSAEAAANASCAVVTAGHRASDDITVAGPLAGCTEVSLRRSTDTLTPGDQNMSRVPVFLLRRLVVLLFSSTSFVVAALARYNVSCHSASTRASAALLDTWGEGDRHGNG
jgi:hypothetical protein